MKILALPNSFKGSLSARETVRLFSQIFKEKHSVKALPISDGFIDFFKVLDPQAKTIFLKAKNAFLKEKRTSFLLLSDRKTAIVETARICGLGSAKREELDVLGASSYGVGQVILRAAELGARTIYIGLGGVACNDGGTGMAAACGARFFDKKGIPLALGALPLLKLNRIDLTSLKKNLKGIRLVGIADVTNPLLGPHGSARVFGPQKGATPEQVKILEKAMSSFARIIEKTNGKKLSRKPSTAAAGAIAAGLYGCFGGKLILGADFLFKKAGLEKYFPQTDLVITTEGKLDKQTFFGKAPLAVLKLAKKYKKKVLFICGKVEEESLRNNPYAPQQIAVLTDVAPDEETAQKKAAFYIRKICKRI